jgi:hypothetical protein
LFVKLKSGFLDIVPASNKDARLEDDSKLVYLGKKIDA